MDQSIEPIQEVKELALKDIRGKLSPALSRYLRENVAEDWHSALTELKASIEDERHTVIKNAEDARRPVDIQMFEVEWKWIENDIDKKLKESRGLLEEKSKKLMQGNMSELVGEFKKIRILLEGMFGNKKR